MCNCDLSIFFKEMASLFLENPRDMFSLVLSTCKKSNKTEEERLERDWWKKTV